MVITKELANKIVFGILLAFPLLVSSIELNILLLSFISLFVISNLKRKYSQSTIKLITPLLVIVFISIISSLFFPSTIFDSIKDFFFLLKPVLYIIIGYFLISTIKDKSFVFKILIYLGVFFAIRHLYFVITFLSKYDFNVNRVRDYSGRDNAIEIFALLFLISSKLKSIFTFDSKYKNFFLILLICSFICYFSRTVTVSVIILFLSIQGYLIITRKGLMYMFWFLTSVSIFYIYLFSVDLERGAGGLEGFLYKVKIAPAEIFDSKINIDDHSDLWDHWRAYEAQKAIEQAYDTPIHYGFVAGKGIGSLVDLKFVAPLTVEGIQYITTLHNGYAYIIFKSGILGLVSYLVFLLMLYMLAYSKHNNQKIKIVNLLLSGIAIYYMFTTLIVSGLYNPRDFVALILGAFLYLQFYYKNTQGVIKLIDKP